MAESGGGFVLYTGLALLGLLGTRGNGDLVSGLFSIRSVGRFSQEQHQRENFRA